jgi:Protein of unknown function (DUF3102)
MTAITKYDDDQQFAANEAEEIRGLLKRAARDIVTIGQKLIAVKARLKHGEWGEWLRDQFDWDERTARRFMSVGEAFKTDNLSDLDIAPSALYLLAAPSTPEDIRQSILEQARAGARITLAAVRDAIGGDEAKALPPAPDLDERYKYWLKSAPRIIRRYPKRLDEVWMAAIIDGEIDSEDLAAMKLYAKGKITSPETLSPNLRFWLRAISDSSNKLEPEPNENELTLAFNHLDQTCDGVNLIVGWLREYFCTFCYGELPAWGNFRGSNPYPFSDYGRCCDKCDEDVLRGRMCIIKAATDDVFYDELSAAALRPECSRESFAYLTYDVATKTRNGEPGGFPMIKIPPEKVRVRADGTAVLELT